MSEFRESPMLKRSPTYHPNSITLSYMVLKAGLVKEINIDSFNHELKYIGVIFTLTTVNIVNMLQSNSVNQVPASHLTEI